MKVRVQAVPELGLAHSYSNSFTVLIGTIAAGWQVPPESLIGSFRTGWPHKKNLAVLPEYHPQSIFTAHNLIPPLLRFLSHLSFFPLCDLGLSFLVLLPFAPSQNFLSFVLNIHSLISFGSLPILHPSVILTGTPAAAFPDIYHHALPLTHYGHC